MDPALRKMVEEGSGDDVIEAIIRLSEVDGEVPRPAREVSRFGDVRTVRLKRRHIVRLWSNPDIASVKAPVMLHVDDEDFFGLATLSPTKEPALFRNRDLQSANIAETGRGIAVGVIDWGFDFAHPAFLRPDGSSRIRALWDQRGGVTRNSPSPFEYGRSFSSEHIDAALQTRNPYRVLGYHPADADRGSGAHGTHVADIAAGSRLADGYGGVAPEAELIFVHLSSSPLSGLANLGDSGRLLEAIDYIDKVAGDLPLVINLSMGRQGGPHTGLTLVERALDNFLSSGKGRIICQSAGNYFLSRSHTSGQLSSGKRQRFHWRVKQNDPTPNELEIWYPNRDRLRLEITPPGGKTPMVAKLGQTLLIQDQQKGQIGQIFHRSFDPNTPDHHINIFLNTKAPTGEYRVDLVGEYVLDGRYDSWTERDPAGMRGQSTFREFTPAGTIGSICNGWYPLVVGAGHMRADGSFTPAPFASAGPTRDGRRKPDLMGPGYKVWAAKSHPRRSRQVAFRTSMSGASQATPYVAGLTALLLERGQRIGRALSIHDVRNAIIGSAVAQTTRSPFSRMGAGWVDPVGALAMVQDHRAPITPPGSPKELNDGGF